MSADISNKLKLLITGANGFIGTNFIKKISNSYKIIALIHTNDTIKKLYKQKHIVFESHDIVSNDVIERIVSHNPDIVLHLANFGYLRDCENNPDKAYQTNVIGLTNVVKACEKINSKIIFTSSREVYGETTGQNSSETDILHPNNTLGKTKVLAENFIKSASNTSKFDYTIIRPSNIFGPFSLFSVVGLMLTSALKERKISVYGGQQTLNLVYIDNVIDIIDKIIRNPKLTRNITLNVGSNKNITMIELAKKLASLFTKKIDILKLQPRDAETKYFKPNLDKVQNMFSYNSKKTLDEELKETLDWFKKYTDSS